MKNSTDERVKKIMSLCPSDDVVNFTFTSSSGREYVCIYADTIADKTAIGELIVKPLAAEEGLQGDDGASCSEHDCKGASCGDESVEQGCKGGSCGGESGEHGCKSQSRNEVSGGQGCKGQACGGESGERKGGECRCGGKGGREKDAALKIACPQLKDCADEEEAALRIAEGCCIVLGEGVLFAADVKAPPQRAVMEPPTQVALKGPREGFTEDIKTNLGLVRKRIKSDALRIKFLSSGKRSQTAIALCYLDDVVREGLVEKVEEQIAQNKIDLIPDSSYVAGFVSKRPGSLFRRNGTCEKPDIFCAKVCEGRVGIIVDGSPIALTLPYALTEDFQTAEDYYVVSYRATFLRFLRVFALVAGILLPSMYVCAQLFKIQLIPKKLLFKIASSVEGIPLSPSVEMLFTLIVLEVLNEASVRMPKYVGLALSVVGALVLGDTAVKAGIISTPAVIIVAFSAICLYTVPDMVETSTLLRLLCLIVAGSLGIFGILVLAAIIIAYLASESDYGTPLLSPMAPMNFADMRDGVYKAGLSSLDTRPNALYARNKVRYKRGEDDQKRS